MSNKEAVRITALKPEPATRAIAQDLEDQGLIRLMRPRDVTASVAPGHVTVDEWYLFSEPYKLVSVGINWSHVGPAWHPQAQDELVMMLSGGRLGKPLYFVFGLRGHAELERRVQAGTLGEQDFFGEVPFFERLQDPGVVRATIKALNDVRVLTVDKRTIVRRLHEDPALGYRIIETMSRRLRSLEEEVVRLVVDG